MPRAIGFTLGALVVLAAGTPGSAQQRRPVGDAQIVAQAQLVARGEHIEVYRHGVNVDPSFLKLAEDAYRQIEGSGFQWDVTVLGPTIRIYVSDLVPVSHVWGGYDHPREPKAIIFLNQRAYHGAMRRINATYIHETVHLFTWRFHSHTLREGLADYVALKILPGTGVGPSPEGYDWSEKIPSEILDYLGTTKAPPPWVTTDMAKRRAYYFASYRLVKYLVETKGLETFMKLYKSENPETEIRTLYGITREESIKAAGM